MEFGQVRLIGRMLSRNTFKLLAWDLLPQRWVWNGELHVIGARFDDTLKLIGGRAHDAGAASAHQTLRRA